MCAYPLCVFVFAFNPFSIFAFGNHSIGIVPVILTVLTFIALARDRTLVASVLCGVGSYISIYPGYLMLAVLAQCRKRKFRVYLSIFAFVLTLSGLLFSTYHLENSWGFLRHCYLSNIYARNTTPNLGLFWYMYVEMFAHFNVFFVWTMQLIIIALCFGLLFRFYEDPLFLALLLIMTTGVLRPYNSVSDLGCSLALLMHWRHLFTYFKNTFILAVLTAVALILAPLFHLTWLHTGTSNANFYFSASLIIGIVRVQLLTQTISAYLRYQFHRKFGPQPCLSTGTKIVPCIRS
ncbi:Phosphatidylinositol glycan anchor biosynthesi clas U protein [Taenia crassiceps]|uniref:Phosphatidylinositol glycan anchor biosynthesi clas U protein n=1 Tax=Taenia crassiceps TaxID=6207 RepID=A0ABR4Q4N6_9CEST